MQRDGTLITNQRYMHVDWLITRHFITNRRSRYTKKRIETGQRCVGERSPILLNIIGVSIDKSRGKPIIFSKIGDLSPTHLWPVSIRFFVYLDLRLVIKCLVMSQSTCMYLWLVISVPSLCICTCLTPGTESGSPTLSQWKKLRSSGMLITASCTAFFDWLLLSHGTIFLFLSGFPQQNSSCSAFTRL